MKRNTNKFKSQGVGILEVLIALVVVSVGVLGLAGMQLNGVRVAKGSDNRSQGVLYAEMIIAQMRANPGAVAAFTYNGKDSNAIDCSAKPVPYCYAYNGGPATTPSCTTSDAIADNDFFATACGQWNGSDAENGLKDELPLGRIVINCDDAPCLEKSSYSVQVSWSETEVRDGSDAAETKGVTMRVIP
jgi:type IV pilus assembly protein PilV